MASMPGHRVSKGPFSFLDGQFASTAQYPAALAALGADPNAHNALLAAAQNRLGAVNPAAVTHFDNDWLGTQAGWGPLAPADTLRIGLQKAIEHATSKGLPMEFFWLCSKDKAFEVYYCEGPRQVTVLVFTPLPDHGPGHSPHSADPLTNATNIWVVKLGDNDDQNYPGGPPQDLGPVTSPPPAPPNGRIIWQRLLQT